MEEPFERIRQYVDGHYDKMLALWEEMVNTEDGSCQLEGVAAMGDILRRELESVGAKVRVLPVENAGGVPMAKWNSGSPKAPLLFIDYVGTVFKEGTAEDNPSRIDEQGRVYGPGVLDMRVGLAVTVCAIKVLVVASFTGRPVKCVFVGDEENLHMLPNAKQAMTEGIKGTAAALNFETGFPDNRLVAGRKGGGSVSLTAHGASAHPGNVLGKGHSVVLEAAHKIVALEACNGTSRGKLTNCGEITGSVGENTIPDLRTTGISVRFPSTEIKNEILDAPEQVVSHSTVPDTWVELDTSHLMERMDITDGVVVLFRHIQRTVVRCGMDKPGYFQIGGLSGSGTTAACGIPTMCAVGVRGEGNHTPTEYAEVESFSERCTLAVCAAGSLEDGFTEQ